MRRRIFALASAVSLLLFLMAVVLWVRSFWVEDSLRREFHQIDSYSMDDSGIILNTSCGRVSVRRYSSVGEPAGTTAWRYDSTPQGLRYSHQQFLPRKFEISL